MEEDFYFIVGGIHRDTRFARVQARADLRALVPHRGDGGTARALLLSDTGLEGQALLTACAAALDPLLAAPTAGDDGAFGPALWARRAEEIRRLAPLPRSVIAAGAAATQADGGAFPGILPEDLVSADASAVIAALTPLCAMSEAALNELAATDAPECNPPKMREVLRPGALTGRLDWSDPYPSDNLHLAICDGHGDRIFVPAVALIIIAELTGEDPFVADTIRQCWGATPARFTDLPIPARDGVLLGLRALYERGLHGWDDDWTFGDEVFSYTPIPLPDAA